jgi:hypothetical protein
MQAVDILSDDASEPARRFPIGKDAVTRVGSGVGEIEVGDAFLPPVFLPRARAPQKIVEIYRAGLRPDSLRRAEIGNAALGADPRSGECHGGASHCHPFGKKFGVVHASSIAAP